MLANSVRTLIRAKLLILGAFRCVLSLTLMVITENTPKYPKCVKICERRVFSVFALFLIKLLD